MPDKAQEAVNEIYQAGYEDGYAAGKAEFDAALVDAQRAGYDVGYNAGRQEVYEILKKRVKVPVLNLVIRDLERSLL